MLHSTRAAAPLDVSFAPPDGHVAFWLTVDDLSAVGMEHLAGHVAGIAASQEEFRATLLASFARFDVEAGEVSFWFWAYSAAVG
jgi:hypothetical protein